MDTKDILKKAITGVINQGRCCIDSLDDCRYRIGTLRCAVGFLINDENYSDKLEMGMGVKGTPVREAVEGSIGRKLTEDELDYLQDIQIAHDDASSDKDEIQAFKEWIAEYVKHGKLPNYCLEFLE